MNNKGLYRGTLAVIIVLFMFAILSTFGLVLWDGVNNAFQNLDEDIADNETKQKIDDLTTYMLWSDTLFIWFFIAILISYLISASVSPVDRPVFILIFLGMLIFVTMLAMIFSNAWNTMTSIDVLSGALEDLTFTDWVMRFFPVITFVIGIIGGIIFYSRGSKGAGGFASGGGEDFS